MFARPTITTIRADLTRWGEPAAQTLLWIAGGSPMRGSQLLLPVDLVVRHSTGLVLSIRHS